MRPTLEDFVVEMPRGAQVIYPKDLAPICMLADIGPGVRVLESGIGSGALSMTMLRWGAEIIGYEVRGDFSTAVTNVRSFLGEEALSRITAVARPLRGDRRTAHLRPGRARPARTLAGRSARRAGDEARRNPRRVHAVDHVQAARTREALESERGSLSEPRGAEPGLVRGSSRCSAPDHRMVAHTGFLTVARLLGRPDPDAPGWPPGRAGRTGSRRSAGVRRRDRVRAGERARRRRR
ncbi:MAG: tRNA (adenine-N1)-methyltransferase [Ilumatobacteraceae bacterium]